MIVKIKKLYEDSIIPTKGSADAMCYDCYAQSIHVNENGKTEVDLGFSLELPAGYGARLIPRSNLTKHWWVLNNSLGVIDPDYRGICKAIFTPIPIVFKEEGNMNNTLVTTFDFPYKAGDRVCQMEIYRRENFDFEEVDELSETERGTGGFGSTGK